MFLLEFNDGNSNSGESFFLAMYDPNQIGSLSAYFLGLEAWAKGFWSVFLIFLY